MGTRHLIVVIDDSGETKVAQYSHWDGYIEGAGIDILDFLKTTDLKNFQKRLEKCEFLEDEEIDKICNSCSNLKKEYPSMSRDTGSGILNFINDTINYFHEEYDFTTKQKKKCHFGKDLDSIPLADNFEFGHDSLFCEFAYVINFQTDKFDIYRGSNKDEVLGLWSGNEENDKEYKSVTLTKSYSLENLPCESDFVSDLVVEEDEDE